MKGKGFHRIGISVLLAAVLAVCLLGTARPAYAYYDRGDVTVKLGLASTTLETGESVKVSVTLSPSSSDQTEGCGMEECPQTCGSGCFDANGNCTCAGSSYTTYYTEVSVSSSNTSVASASYSSGSLTIKAIGTGSATITVTGSLRQYTSGSAQITVTVESLDASDASSSDGTSSDNTSSDGTSSDNTSSDGTSSGSTSSGDTGTDSAAASKSSKKKSANQVTVSKNKASGDESEDTDTQEESETDSDENTVITAQKNGIKYYFRTITGSLQGSGIFRKIKGKTARVVFQKKDDSDTVLYSFRFSGKKLKNTKDASFGLELSECSDTDLTERTEGIVLAVSLSQAGKFPGPCSMQIRVADYYENGQTLYLYRLGGDGEYRLIGTGSEVTNGYFGQTIRRGGEYILTTGLLSEEDEAAVQEAEAAAIAEADGSGTDDGGDTAALETEAVKTQGHTARNAAVIIVIAAAAVCVLLIGRNRRNRQDGQG